MTSLPWINEGHSLHQEGEWSALHRASTRARRWLMRGVGLIAGGSSVLVYVETWLPLLIMSLTVAILFGVAAFIMGRAGT
jgi:hypothetical protein